MSPIVIVVFVGVAVLVGAAIWVYAVRKAKPGPQIATALRSDGPEVNFQPPQEPPK